MPAPRKVDLIRLHQAEYIAPRNPRIVVAGKGQYLALGGTGTPGDTLFRSHVSALCGIAYALQRAKKQLGKDFKVCPLEGLWQKRVAAIGPGGPDARWSWKLLIRVPTFVQRRDLAPACAALAARGRSGAAADVRLVQLKEGRCVQALHVGATFTEEQTLERMRNAAREAGLAFHGQRHEIYLCDPRRVPPERMRTILRQPVRAAR